MEILSAGEKIKRSRVYQGLTLKDVCEDKISVSKMSCIENNKVEPEEWILEIVRAKLNLDMDYLKHGIREQIEGNIEKFNSMKQLMSLEDVLRSVEYSEKYNYHDLSCKLFNILFEYYLNRGMKTELSTVIPRYYNSCQKSKDEILHINYYMNIAKYLYSNGEIEQAGSYISTVRKKLIGLNKKNSIEYIKATYNQVAINITNNKIDKAIEISKDLCEILSFSDDEYINAEIYKVLSIVEIYSKGDKAKQYELEAFRRYGQCIDKKAAAYYDIAKAKFSNGDIDGALEYIKKALDEFPRENKESLCEFLIDGAKSLIECEALDLALKYIEEALDLSIEIEFIPTMEKAYYYKGIVYEKKKNYVMAETCMVLSLDTLIKYGTKGQIYKRYMKLGSMYHGMNNVRDSIHYFNLAFKENNNF
ncbi:MAG: helix-turn-helix transcriptional regulator [Clostridium sp.]|uniref:helix-turn-helix domain-containing protein n=1 Tax=Clostridium sp. TaxID=1506 RepID=UPI003217F3D0